MSHMKWAFLATFCSTFANAGSLSAPFSLDSAAVLPKGVRSVRLSTINTAVAEKFGDSGTSEPLGASLNKEISYTRLIDSQKPTPDRLALKGYIMSRGSDLGETAGFAHGEVNSRVNVFVPMAAVGLTDKLTFAVAVPIIHSEVNVATGWTASDGLNGAVSDMVTEGRREKVLQYEKQLQNVVHTEFSSKGYETPADQSKTQIGDVVVVLKQKIYEIPKIAAAVQGRVVLPTGKRADLNNVFDVAGGDGQFDVGAGFVVDYYMTPKLTVTAATSYTSQLATQVETRVPVEQNESLTPDIDRGARMDLGDLYSQTLTARYGVVEGLSAGLGGAVQYKGRDSYSGAAYEARRYGWLEDETEQTMFSATVALTGSTIPAFRKAQFPLPLEVTLTGSQVFKGRNVNANTLAAIELVAFF